MSSPRLPLRDPAVRRPAAALVTGGALLTLAAAAVVPAAAVPSDPPPTRVVVVVIDGLNIEEVSLMPFLSSQAEQGTYYTEGRSVMVAETIPNHVSMVTGAYPDRTGIPANSFPGVQGSDAMTEAGTSDESVEAGNPELLQADSLFTLVQEQCPQLEADAVTSKDYLFTILNHDRTGDGEVDADFNFANVDDPTFIPGAGLTPDERTITVAAQTVQERDPDFLFINLGSVDRVGHVDEAGGLTTPLPTGSRPALRDVQRTNTDEYLRAFVEQLQSDDRWEDTALIFTADHSMDWSLPTSTVSLSPEIESDPLLAGEIVIAQNGGAALYSLKDRQDPQAAERLKRLREIAVSQDGVDEALYRQPNPADGGEEHWVGRVHPDWHQTGPRTGDLILTVKDGRRVTEPEPFSNPIPGNHGMPSTLRVPTIVSGGLDVVDQRVEGSSDPDVRPADQAENVDVAPTAAWLLGVQPPEAGFDGRMLSEAFASQPAPTCVSAAAAPSESASPSASPSSDGSGDGGTGDSDGGSGTGGAGSPSTSSPSPSAAPTSQGRTGASGTTTSAGASRSTSTQRTSAQGGTSQLAATGLPAALAGLGALAAALGAAGLRRRPVRDDG